jgi:periplasmic protein TonB
VPAAKAITKIPPRVLGPLACSLAAHLAIACPLLFLAPRTIGQPAVEAGTIPVTLRLASPGEQSGAPGPAPGPAAQLPLTIRRAVRSARRTALPPVLATTSGANAATAPASQAVPPALEGAMPVSPTTPSENAQAHDSPATGVSTTGPSRGAAASAGAPPAPGWSPGDGPWMQLRQAVERHLTYPPVGRRMGWAGRVVLAFTLRADGDVEEVRVQESSGRAALDASAVQAVHRTVPLPHPNQVVRIVLPIEFALR